MAHAGSLACEAAEAAVSGDWETAGQLLAAVGAETGREGTTAAVGVLCDLVIARNPAPPSWAGQDLAPDWPRCWADWAVSVRRDRDDRFLASLVAANREGSDMEAMCLGVLLAAAAGRTEGALS